MTSLLNRLVSQNLIQPPGFLPDNTHFLVIMGSQAYGTSQDDSDWDVYGWCIPYKEMVFPHLAGEIVGFGTQVKRFEQWQQHHVEDKSSQKQYDFTVFNVVKYLQLVMQNNPNMIDSLFVPQHCIIHSSRIGELVRENRKLFLHKGCWHSFKGYAYSQIHKAKSQTREGKRAQVIDQFGYDVKFASHCIRLMNEVEQILTEQDLDLQRNSEQVKSVRRGEWTLQQVEEYFSRKEVELETVYTNSSLPYGPDEKAIKGLLLNVLEEHFGDLSSVVQTTGQERLLLAQIAAMVRPYSIS